MTNNQSNKILWWLLGIFAASFAAGAGAWADNTNKKVTETSDKVLVLEAKLAFLIENQNLSVEYLKEIDRKINLINMERK